MGEATQESSRKLRDPGQRAKAGRAGDAGPLFKPHDEQLGDNGGKLIGYSNLQQACRSWNAGAPLMETILGTIRQA